MKYSWQNRQAPLRRPSIVDALIINSISGTSLAPFDDAAVSLDILTLHLFSIWNWMGYLGTLEIAVQGRMYIYGDMITLDFCKKVAMTSFTTIVQIEGVSALCEQWWVCCSTFQPIFFLFLLLTHSCRTDDGAFFRNIHGCHFQN